MINTISEHGSGASVRTTRREFLQSTAMGAVGVSVAATSPRHANLRAVRGQACRAVILILNVGGPSQLDTWDPKPDAPEEIRGPFRAIQTSVPGIAVSELFPRHAVIAHHLAFVRSCHHSAPAVHEVGWQLAQTGRDFSPDVPMPHVGQVASRLLAQPERVPQHAVLPAVVRKRHRRLPTGQTSESGVCPAKNAWGRALWAATRESDAARRRYGPTRFGESCLVARRLVETGVRFVTINTSLDVFERDSWDVHGTHPFGTVAEMKQTSAPAYDQAYSALIEDLAARNLLPETLVCCVAEFGRTPRVNPGGGRDHWPRCWTVCLAGGGIRGGQVIGRSDPIGAEPAERPVNPAELVATMYHCLGLDVQNRLPVPHHGPILDPGTEPIWELF